MIRLMSIASRWVVHSPPARRPTEKWSLILITFAGTGARTMRRNINRALLSSTAYQRVGEGESASA